MIDPAKAQAAALSLFDASCQNVRAIIADPGLANEQYSPLNEALVIANAAARNVIRVRNQLQELSDLTNKP